VIGAASGSDTKNPAHQKDGRVCIRKQLARSAVSFSTRCGNALAPKCFTLLAPPVFTWLFIAFLKLQALEKAIILYFFLQNGACQDQDRLELLP